MSAKEVNKRLQHLYEQKESTLQEESKYVYTKSVHIRHWLVGMTVAYRKRPTVKATVVSLSAAGWSNPILFAEPNSNNLPDSSLDIRVLKNETVLGNWKNFCCRLEYMVKSQAKYLLLVQDDVEFLPGTREWLENNWPCNNGIVSLYRSARYAIDKSTEESNKIYDILSLGHTFLGMLAVAITHNHAESLLMNLEAMTDTNPQQDDIKFGKWAHALRIPINIVRDSRCQHTGVTSSVYPHTTTISNSRKADTYYNTPCSNTNVKR